jgi:transcriptional regulator with XRE-family HTH domain
METVLERTPTRNPRSQNGSARVRKTADAPAAPAQARKGRASRQAPEPKVMHRKGSLKGLVTNPKTLADRLISRRQALDLSQENVAEQIRFWNNKQHCMKTLSRSAYCMYESGEVTPDLNKLGLLAKVLKCSVGWLALGLGDEPATTDNLIEEVVWNSADRRFDMKQTWGFDADWTTGRYDAPPNQLALTVVNDFAPNVKPGDMAVVRRQIEPNAAGGEFAFVHEDEIKIAHVTRPAPKGPFRIYDADKRHHVNVAGKHLIFLGKMVGKISDL